eukprot:TRINITY_DN22864_c0_g1_i1.p1 TRINITY_DN22864_c0_g1~~TRINITY_DN22864_c0_g1_i1.p1  ORF type:complete len:221 (+),score=60.08 TRINITY_DN22864_c0_g1_i1:38-700(+)
MLARIFAGATFLATLAFSEDDRLNSVLAADDACNGGAWECGIELRQLRGEVNRADDELSSKQTDTQLLEKDEEEEVADYGAEDVDAEEAQDEIAVNKQEEVSAEEDTEDDEDAEVTGRKCMTQEDLKVWVEGGGKQHYDAALDHCGTSCAAGFGCTRDCMKKYGYSDGCASCMAHEVECARDKCLGQCISNHKSPECVHCTKKNCRPVMKHCSGWSVGGH